MRNRKRMAGILLKDQTRSMSTSTLERQTIANHNLTNGACGPRLYSAGASASVNADRSRIYQAITVPEYIETWFSAPGSIPGLTRVFNNGISFCICGPTTQGQRFSIICSYRVCRRSKIAFTWKEARSPIGSDSLVRISLRGDFSRTTVDVSHSGLTHAEQRWCQSLWDASIEKLSLLF